MKRMWINQPSIHQTYHELHGRHVLAEPYTEYYCVVYFLSGDIISQVMPREVLSSGWK